MRRCRLILHVGAGKTGTTSIQKTLRRSARSLEGEGVRYLGLVLEYAPVALYAWQAASRIDHFLEIDPNEIPHQIEMVLRRSLESLQADGYHTAIWSNEVFFDRPHLVVPALESLLKEGANIQVVAYVRRHDAWAKAAYAQWGIKHKTYPGELLPFRAYNQKRPPRYFDRLRVWAETCGDRFFPRNYDGIGDVVLDFMRLFALPEHLLQPVRANETPGAEELLARALFNNSVEQEALPVAFDRVMNAHDVDFNLDPEAWLTSLLPSEDDLQEVKRAAGEDRRLVDRLLAAAGQPPLATQPLAVEPVSLAPERLLSILLQMVVHQARRIRRLEELLAASSGD